MRYSLLSGRTPSVQAEAQGWWPAAPRTIGEAAAPAEEGADEAQPCIDAAQPPPQRGGVEMAAILPAQWTGIGRSV